MEVIGTGGIVRLFIRESFIPGASDGSGPFLDKVSLIRATPICVTSDANLVCNGSFELNDVPDGGDTDFSDTLVPGWSSLRGNVCLVDNRDGVAAPDGFNYAELDCIAGNPVEGLFQDIPTEAGQLYRLTFKMRARDPTRATLEDEGVNVSTCESLPRATPPLLPLHCARRPFDFAFASVNSCI